MKGNKEFSPVRVWRWFRDGFSIYVSKPLTIMTFLTVISGRVPWLIENFGYWMTMIIGLLTLVNLSVAIGYVHWRRLNIPGKENVMTVESNQVQCHNQRVAMEHTLKVMRALDVEPSPEWWDIYNFWKKWDEKWGWAP
jgi:hypothetical protein